MHPSGLYFGCQSLRSDLLDIRNFRSGPLSDEDQATNLVATALAVLIQCLDDLILTELEGFFAHVLRYTDHFFLEVFLVCFLAGAFSRLFIRASNRLTWGFSATSSTNETSRPATLASTASRTAFA